MAEKKPEKKFDKKSDKKGGGDSVRPLEIVVGEIIIVLGIVIAIFYILLGWMGVDFRNGVDADALERTKYSLVSLLSSVQVFAAFVSLLFIMGIIYAKFKMAQVLRTKTLSEKVKQAEERKVEKQASSENKKWKKVFEHVSSSNPSDWRLSILEADILLGELLTKMGYKGEGIGEQLKSADKSEFLSLNEAWEAHKVRNSIAHEGTEFPLSQREAMRVIGLFEYVFKEFYFI